MKTFLNKFKTARLKIYGSFKLLNIFLLFFLFFANSSFAGIACKKSLTAVADAINNFDKTKSSQTPKDAVNQYALGLMYFYVDGVFPQNPKKAVYWIKKAARQGHPHAQYDLSLLYYRGWGVVRNYVQAYKWALIARDEFKNTPELRNVNNTSLEELLSHLESKMKKDQIAEARKATGKLK